MQVSAGAIWQSSMHTLRDTKAQQAHRRHCRTAMRAMCPAGQVYESHEGKLEKVGVAVRRGRMIKCRFCGHRGATLGCHIRSCRTSFHLPCARYNGSRLDVRPLASSPSGYLPQCSAEHWLSLQRLSAFEGS